MLCEICRYYPGYDLEKCGELTWPQISALIGHISDRPYEYVVMVEPKKNT